MSNDKRADREYKKALGRSLFLAMLLNPIFILVYLISMSQLYTICKYGRVSSSIKILIGCIFFYLIWLIFFVVIFNRKLKCVAGDIREILNLNVKFKSIYKVVWIFLASAVIICITAFYGYKIYNTAINYNGKLSWVLESLRNKRNIDFKHNNIYEYGIEGIFTDIEEKIDLPDELYISEVFDLTFSSDGTITSLYTFIYGNNDKGALKSFLIDYNINRSKNIRIHLDGYVNADYSKDMLLKPLRDTMNVISIKDTVSKWNSDEYGMLYYGKRSFAYNTDGIVYVDGSGNKLSLVNATSEIIGYTVFVYVPGEESEYTLVRYNLVESLEDIYSGDSSNLNEEEQNDNINKFDYQIAEEFYLSENLGYRLAVTGAAAGSRFYSLFISNNGGETWEVLNRDPFGSSGGAAGMIFIDEKLGFLALSHSGGSYADLYRTEDGGLSYEKVEMPKVKVALGDGEDYNPFDFPEMPYEENGVLNLLVGQGSDGDYNGNCDGLYKSNDKGKTWEYVKEMK